MGNTEQSLESLTGFFSSVGLASGVSEGIQKLGRLWLDDEAEDPDEDSAELLAGLVTSLPFFCPEAKQQVYSAAELQKTAMTSPFFTAVGSFIQIRLCQSTQVCTTACAQPCAQVCHGE